MPTRKNMLYPNFLSAIHPVAHSEELPLPLPKPPCTLLEPLVVSPESSCVSEFEDNQTLAANT